ncbi:MAG: glycosyltransferase [Pseudomonadota bacterium]
MEEHGDPVGDPADRPLLICDLTQSYSATAGGGVGTYLREKRDHVLAHTPHRLLQIVPGPVNRLTIDGRHIFAEVAARPVRGSPDYRFIVRTRAVRDLLAQWRPDVIESLCPWILPWTAIRHRRAFPDTTLVAGYRTDFPNAHVYRVGRDLFGKTGARVCRTLTWGYAGVTYRAFDHVYTLSEDARVALAQRTVTRTSVLPLGVDPERFSPDRRDAGYRAELGLSNRGPLLIYAGRIDNEKRADRLVAMMRHLPRDLDAALVMIGDGKLRAPLIERTRGLPILLPGYEPDRARLARALASSDIYVSAMADETFGMSVLEAQASGLPVVGVAGGAMRDRVPSGTGLLGPVDDMATMAANIVAVWDGEAAAMGRAGRALALAQGWRRTFDTLFDEIYPAALARTAIRLGTMPIRGHP